MTLSSTWMLVLGPCNITPLPLEGRIKLSLTNELESAPTPYPFVTGPLCEITLPMICEFWPTTKPELPPISTLRWAVKATWIANTLAGAL